MLTTSFIQICFFVVFVFSFIENILYCRLFIRLLSFELWYTPPRDDFISFLPSFLPFFFFVVFFFFFFFFNCGSPPPLLIFFSSFLPSFLFFFFFFFFFFFVLFQA